VPAARLRRGAAPHPGGTAGALRCAARGWFVAFVTLTTLAVRATAGGIRDWDDGWLVPVAALGRVLRATSDAGTAGGKPLAGWATAASGRLYGLASLPLFGLAAGTTFGPTSTAVGWARLGGAIYCEDTCSVRLAGRLPGRPRLTARWHRLRLGDGWSADGFTVAVGATFAVGPGTDCDLDLDLTTPPTWFGDRGPRRALRLRGHRAAALWAVALDRRQGAAPLLEFEADAVVAPAAALGLRAEPASGTFGLTTAWRVGRWLLRTSHLAHPQLGISHRWALTYGALEEIW
jgi:hypothetical protein